MKDNFQQRKRDILEKKDKSSIGEWDYKIKNLCEKINSFENFYTTSSCSGRIVLIIDKDKKESDLFIEVFHALVDFDEFYEIIKKLDLKQAIKFKQEPCILHVACKTLKDAESLLNKGKEVGFKKSGVLSLGKNIIVELTSTEKLEFPVVDLNEEFWKKIVEKANENLEKTWAKIERFEGLI